MITRHVYLASKSPRRLMLLEAAGFEVTVLEIDCDEKYPSHLEKGAIAVYLADLKMEAALTIHLEARPMITADTIVDLNGLILEKPSDAAESREMLSRLSGQIHTVYTGVSIVTPNKRVSFYAETQVQMAELTTFEIDNYIQQFRPFDKAGSYGIQDWIGWTKVTGINGSYANVMGLPVDRIYAELVESQVHS